MTTLSFLFAFVVMLGVLITIHEFGHFIVAKWCGVRVLKFSIGFGPPIGFGRFRMRFVRGGTEYVIAWVPLGGFVRILGEHGEEDEAEVQLGDGTDHLGAKPLWQKLAIYFAGPAMNLALPVAIFVGFLAAGMPRPEAVIGTVEPASPAAAAGLAPGDRIVSLGGEPVRWWDEVDAIVRNRPGAALSAFVQRDGEARRFELHADARSGLDEFGSIEQQGWLGITHERLQAKLGIPSADSPAARAGLRTEDVVVAVDGAPIEDFAGFAARYAAADSGEVALRVARAGAEAEAPAELTVRVPALGSVRALGTLPATALITDVQADSPAGRAGLAAGDLIVAVDGAPVGNFSSFREMVLSSGGRALEITYARRGETRTVAVAPELLEVDTGLGIEEELYRIGIAGDQTSLPGAFADDVERNPLVAVPRAVGMTVDRTRAYMRGLGKIFTGEVSRRQLAGPIGIGVIAHKALQRGWDAYLGMMVLISINLAILNLLPIPVLDGGQIVLYTVEGVKRSPVSIRTRERIQTVGVAVIVMLMGFALWNDVSRYWGKFLDYVRGTGGL